MFQFWRSRRMKRSLHILVGAIPLVLPALAGHGEGSPPTVREAAQAAVAQFRREQPQAEVQMDPATGLARRLTNLRAPRALPGGSGVEEATAFLAKHRTLLLGDRAVEDLQVSQVHSLPTSTHVCYQQCYQGLPVWGARLAIHLDAQGQVRRVQGTIHPQLHLSTSPVLTAPDAIRAARASLGAVSLRGEPKAALGVLPRLDTGEPRFGASRVPADAAERQGRVPASRRDVGRVPASRRDVGHSEPAEKGAEAAEKGAEAARAGAERQRRGPGPGRLAYRVEIGTFEPADWRIFVDARTGAVLSQMDCLMHVEGEGVVVEENLFTTPQTVSRPFTDLDGSGILKGAFVDVQSFASVSGTGTVSGKRLSRASDHRFMAPPTDPRFDEQMLYYHVTRVHDYFHRTFGFMERDHSLPAFAHVPEIDPKTSRVWGTLDNAYYSPVSDAIFFGDGTGVGNRGSGPEKAVKRNLNPTSRDADVIYHEYTHAVVASIVPYLNGVVKYNVFGAALNEGYADYFACTINDDPGEGEYVVASDRGLRNLQNHHHYPEDVNHPRRREPEAHWTGMIWGGACWDLRQKLGAAVADQVIFGALFYLSQDGDADFQAAAQAVLAADQERYSGTHQEVIRQVMSQRGLLQPAPQAALGPLK
jgi:Zn-dependent metalloprotease